MFRRLYPEVYNKRKLELDKQKQAEGQTFNTKNKAGGGVFKDSKAYEAWKSTNPLSCLLYTSPSPRDRTRSRMPSSA